jgi:hypothetical protein
VGRVDVVLEEYKSLRAEILAHSQAQTTIVSVALTATAAIAGFAFGAKADEAQRLQILLALPLVLSGLGLSYLTHSYGSSLIGRYIKERLWPVLQSANPDAGAGNTSWPPSWEHQLRHSGRTALIPPGGWLSWLPGVIIFGAPSVAALAINDEYAWWPLASAHGGGLEWAWFIGAVVAGLALFLLVLAGFSPPSLNTAREDVPDAVVQGERMSVSVAAELAPGRRLVGQAELRSPPEDTE